MFGNADCIAYSCVRSSRRIEQMRRFMFTMTHQEQGTKSEICVWFRLNTCALFHAEIPLVQKETILKRHTIKGYIEVEIFDLSIGSMPHPFTNP